MIADRHVCSRRIALALAGLALLWPVVGASGITSLRLSRAKTRVGLASVYLETSNLAVIGADLTGEYDIRVPLAPWQDDHGRIRLEAVPEVLAGSAGVLRGSATSDLNGKIHAVECTLEPDGDAGIVIRTAARTLTFAARYEGLPVAR